MNPVAGHGVSVAGRRGPLLRYGATAVVTLGLLWLSLAISIAGAMRDARPEIALRFWPGDGSAQANQAEDLMQRSLRAPRHDAELDLAREAIAAEPTSAVAARILAIVSNSPTLTARRFVYARQLSRRDLFINLWFIERAVQRNDVPGALGQYDVTLRTSSQAPRILFPILISAMTHRELDDPIAGLLATGGEWVPDFFDEVLAERSRAPDLGRVVLYRPQVLGRLSPATQARLVAELADDRDFEIGARIYHAVSGRRPMDDAAAPFLSGESLPPFDWSIVDTGNYGAASASTGGPLQIYAQNGSRGTVARRLVRLAPGAYRLSGSGAVSQNDGPGEAQWSISCAQDESGPIATLSIGGPAGDRQVKQASLRIGPACSWYWLNLSANPPSQDGRFEASVDRPRIDRLPG